MSSEIHLQIKAEMETILKKVQSSKRKESKHLLLEPEKHWAILVNHPKSRRAEIPRKEKQHVI